MKMRIVPKAPIQIQRDELIIALTALQRDLTEKDSVIITLQSELKTNRDFLSQKDQVLSSMQSLLDSKIARIGEQEGVIEKLKSEVSIKSQIIKSKTT